jgi:ABC-type transport system involved in cytochrome bd biosynthesis fused ATPase/permease subunit
MTDWFIGFAMAAASVFIFLFGWMVSASTIGWECKNMGVFYVGTSVYECAVKEKK